MKRIGTIIMGLWLLLALPLTAAAATTPLGLWQLDVANDSFFDIDRGYTSGLRLAFSPHDGAWSLGVGQDIYTPDSHNGAQPPPGEHPYGAWLYARYDHRLQLAEPLLLTLSLTGGTTGKRALGEDFQDFAHQTLNFNEYDGWDSQVSERWGWIAGLKIEGLVPVVQSGNYGIDLLAEIEGRGGNIQADLQGGIVLRFGRQLPALRARWQPHAEGAFFFTVGGLRRLVDKNVFLEGVERDDYRVEPERAVNTFTCGVHWHYSALQVDLDFYIPEQEFKGQEHSYRYGVLSLGYWF